MTNVTTMRFQPIMVPMPSETENIKGTNSSLAAEIAVADKLCIEKTEDVFILTALQNRIDARHSHCRSYLLDTDNVQETILDIIQKELTLHTGLVGHRLETFYGVRDEGDKNSDNFGNCVIHGHVLKYMEFAIGTFYDKFQKMLRTLDTVILINEDSWALAMLVKRHPHCRFIFIWTCREEMEMADRLMDEELNIQPTVSNAQYRMYDTDVCPIYDRFWEQDVIQRTANKGDLNSVQAMLIPLNIAEVGEAAQGKKIKVYLSKTKRYNHNGNGVDLNLSTIDYAHYCQKEIEIFESTLDNARKIAATLEVEVLLERPIHPYIYSVPQNLDTMIPRTHLEESSRAIGIFIATN